MTKYIDLYTGGFREATEDQAERIAALEHLSQHFKKISDMTEEDWLVVVGRLKDKIRMLNLKPSCGIFIGKAEVQKQSGD